MKPKHIFMMSIIGQHFTSMHAFRCIVDSWSRLKDLLGDDMIIFFTSAIMAGSNDASLEFADEESAFTMFEM